MSTQYTNGVLKRVHIHHWIWALFAVVTLGGLLLLSRQAAALDSQLTGEQRLVTVYDQGEEKTFITNRTTIGSALREQNIAVESADSVEPALSTPLSAKNYTVNIYRARSVIVEDGTVKTQVVTAEQSPKKIVAAIGSALYPEDLTRFDLARNPLSEGGAGLRLTIDRATPFTFSLYGTTVEARSQATTVGDMLREKNVSLGPKDGQSVPNDTPLVAGMTVAVWRDGKQTLTQEEIIPKTIEEIKDADKDYGARDVKSQGSDGKKSVTYEIEMQGGKEISRTVIASVTTVEPVKQTIIIGTRFRGAYTTPSQNETITWNFLIGKGLTREQTAGIMGNLMQEHGFNTTGDGLAQWTGGRKAALLALPDPYSIDTQLNFLWSELSGGYAKVLAQIQASSTVEGAVVAFQNGYERCGICAESKRVQYAYNILASH